MGSQVFIGLGSNMGDKAGYLNQALEQLGRLAGVSLKRVSSFYHTEPWGYQDQDWFLNAVAEIATDLPPRALLQRLQEIENSLGRVRTIHWGPRTIDLDILLYDQAVIKDADLVIPHPRLAERQFVLEPLAEIAPGLALPGGRTVEELLGKYS